MWEGGKNLGAFGKIHLRKATVNSFISVSPSVRMEQLGCHSTYFLKVYNGEFTKLRRPIRVVWLKQDKNERHFAWRRTYIYVVGFYNSCILFSMSYKLKSKKPLPICTQPRVTNEFKSVEQSMSLRYGENLKEQQSEGARNIMYCVHFLSCLYCLYKLTELLWPRRFCCHFVRHLELALVNRNKHKSDTLNTNIYTF